MVYTYTSDVHADLVCPIDVLLDLNPANGQAKVMYGRCGAAETRLTLVTCGLALSC